MHMATSVLSTDVHASIGASDVRITVASKSPGHSPYCASSFAIRKLLPMLSVDIQKDNSVLCIKL